MTTETRTYAVKTEKGWTEVKAASPQAIREEYRAKGIQVFAILAR